MGGVLLLPTLTYRGVPLTILWQFIQDPQARDAYFTEDKQALHDRLKDLGVETAMQDFYRPKFPNDEQGLDQHIHQLLYDNTGYVGEGYRLTAEGTLTPKVIFPQEFQRWFELARAHNLVDRYTWQQNELVLVTPAGHRASYRVLRTIYPLKDLEKAAR